MVKTVGSASWPSRTPRGSFCSPAWAAPCSAPGCCNSTSAGSAWAALPRSWPRRRQPLAAFVILTAFFLGTLIAEPAREALVASLTRPEARTSYMGASRLGLALGGGAGGWLYDFAQRQHQAGLPWLLLAAAGALTFIALTRQFGAAAPRAAKQAA